MAPADLDGVRQLAVRDPGAPVGILFARRDFLSAFMTCFLPIIGFYYPLMLFGYQPEQRGIMSPLVALDRQRPAGRPGRICLAVGRKH